MPHTALMDVCVKLIKYKKENKELLHYLLFESSDERTYAENLKSEVSSMFEEVNTQTLYFAKKTIRKILRLINKYCRFSDDPRTYISLLMHFCAQMNTLPLDWHSSKVMMNLYQSQLNKAMKLVSTLHEDLHYDYQESLEDLQQFKSLL